MSKIVILGGGFGGVRAALDLSRQLGDSAEITLIDRNPYHLFIPLIYEVATAFNIPEDEFSVLLKKTIAIPYADIFQGHKINFVQAEIERVDLASQDVYVPDRIFKYDYLVIALGSQPADFNISGVREYAYQFKVIEDALMIRQKVLSLFQDLGQGSISSPIKIMIVGAGFSGIELASELATFCKNLSHKLRIKKTPVQIYIFEGTDKILPAISERERGIIRRRLTDLGIIIMERSPIEAIQDANTIKLKSTGQTMTGNMIVWTAGLQPNVFLKSIPGLQLTTQGRIVVAENLTIIGSEKVFGVGDNIQFMDHTTQKPIPALAYLAIDHGKVAAQNIIRSIKGKPLIKHRPLYTQWGAPLGGKYALVHLSKGISIKGLTGWIIRGLIDLKYFISILPLGMAMWVFWQEIQVFTRND